MKIRLAALSALVLAGPSLGQPRLDPGDYKTVMLRPVTLAEAVSQFEQICIATRFDPKAFETAIGASSWPFGRQQGTGTPAPDVRLAPQGIVNFHSPPLQQKSDFVPGQCNMEAVIDPAEGRPAVSAALEGALSRALGAVPARFEFPGEGCWRWKPEPEQIYRLCMIYRADLVGGHMAWSLQRWTANGERRAGLTPPAGKDAQ